MNYDKNEIFEFYSLCQEKMKDVTSSLSIIVKTKEDKIFVCQTDIFSKKIHEDEDSFVESLKQNNAYEIKMLICMLKEGNNLEPPSHNLIKRINELSPDNKECLVIGQGFNGLVIKELKAIL